MVVSAVVGGGVAASAVTVTGTTVVLAATVVVLIILLALCLGGGGGPGEESPPAPPKSCVSGHLKSKCFAQVCRHSQTSPDSNLITGLGNDGNLRHFRSGNLGSRQC